MKKNVTDTEKRNDLTELVFILDRSGSMAGLEEDTIGGFNSLIDKQKGQEGECCVTTVIFDHEVETIHDRIRLADVPRMTDREYSVRGSTALIDAIGKTVEHIADIHKYARPEDVPGHVMFVITTDGMENSSHVYSSAKVKKMIEKKKEEGWEFLFIGANIDSVETAKTFGISEERAVNYHADKKGTSKLFKAVGAAVCCMRAAEPVSDAWREDLDADYQSRKYNNR